jgi:hypothetical protein
VKAAAVLCFLRILKAGESFSRLLLILPTCYISVERVFNAAGDGILVVYKPVASYLENHNSARSAEQGIGCLFYLRQMHR